jgi:ParB-like chromosome segregation protein Spo0J
MAPSVALTIKQVLTDSLKGYEKNARTHSLEQIRQLADSISQFGFVNPILVDGSAGVIAGHGRLAAAKSLKLPTVPVIELSHLSPAQKRALILADNKLALNAGWDAELLQAEIAALADEDFDLTSIGFSEDELEAILEAEDVQDVIETAPSPVLRSQVERRASDIVEQREQKAAAAEEPQPDADLYTKKIKAPVYEPKGEKPPVEALVDNQKVDALISEIGGHELPLEVKSFLIDAARRHAVFDYQKIAEFYAHAPAEIQHLMERSALVIIDFDKAIENGFVQLTKDLAEVYPQREEAPADAQ